ncbi:hypothetical protein KJ644_04225 [Candidatus Dependentiae bacterium]|nr:hypothetical protein [Candidatus Dependentiae bacterium]MBU4387650.1 hypothetical protein [Candidatus Dependentiae bacterium]MCG2756347.1 hypothetical protein [Candidatus Dependentiae bacterium]
MNPNNMNNNQGPIQEKQTFFKRLKNIAITTKNRLKTHMKNHFPIRIWAKGSEKHKGPKI